MRPLLYAAEADDRERMLLVSRDQVSGRGRASLQKGMHSGTERSEPMCNLRD
jgi:hypothetical protein